VDQYLLPIVAAVLSVLLIAGNRSVAMFLVDNGTTPFTFLRPQDRLPREDRPERLEEYRRSRTFWLPKLRVFVVCFGVLVLTGSAVRLVEIID
jgi:hypothetical protein